MGVVSSLSMNRHRSQRHFHTSLGCFMPVMLSRGWRLSTGSQIHLKSGLNLLNRSSKKHCMSGSKRSLRGQVLALMVQVAPSIGLRPVFSEISLFPTPHFGDLAFLNASELKTLRHVWT